ncbi:MAG: restriction endonuclease subunit S [Anaerovoracaceae bacterium]
MMNEWKEVKLGEVIHVEMGQSPKSEFYNTEGAGLPFLQGNRTFGDKYPTIDTYCTDIKKIANKNDILMSVRAPVGDLNIANRKICIGRGLCSMNFKNNNTMYLYYVLKQNIAKLINRESGTVFGSVNKKDILGLEVLYTQNELEQKAIADTLSCLDDKIEINNKINKNLEAQAQAIFKSWFVDFEPFQDGEFVDSEMGRIPKGWRVGTLGEVADIQMGQSPKGISYNEDKIGTVFYQGRTDFGIRYPKVRLYTTDPKRMANKNDILLSVRAPVGDINIAGEICCIGRGLASLKSKIKCNSFVLYYLLILRDKFDIYNGEGTVFGSINKDALNNIKIIIPQEKIIFDFQTIVESIDSCIQINSKEAQILTDIRDILLPNLMNGEIRVPMEVE